MSKVSSFKKISRILIVPFVFSFLLFIHEPIVMLASNIDDFWFDFGVLIRHSLLLFFGSLVALSAFMLILHKISAQKIYPVFFFLLFGAFLIFYIHSNYLAGFLPQMDGKTFDWSGKAANISSIIVCIVVIATIIVALKMLGKAKLLKVSNYVSLAVFAMLVVSIVSLFATKPVLKDKSSEVVATNYGINKLSTKDNYLIFMIDAVDSQDFQRVVESDDEYKEMMKDFSYFPDTLSGYAYTRESVPFIFSGEWFENGEQHYDYSTKAFTNSKLLNHVGELGYDRYFFDDEIFWDDDSALGMKNVIRNPQEAKSRVFIHQEIKYILFKVLPFPLKRFSFIDRLNFGECRVEPEEGLFSWRNMLFKDYYLEMDNELVDDKIFQFLHIEGAHVPFNMDENAEPIDESVGTYEQKVKGTVVLVKMYLNRLNVDVAFDNSTIIILADHSFSDDYEYSNPNWRFGRYNPVLYIKGQNEHHHATKVSDKQVSHADFAEAFSELADGKKSAELFSEVPESGRERRIMIYGYNAEDHMEEYLTDKKAWEYDGLRPTGRVYDLEAK